MVVRYKFTPQELETSLLPNVPEIVADVAVAGMEKVPTVSTSVVIPLPLNSGKVCTTVPPGVLKVMAKIHKDQKLPGSAPGQKPWLFQGFVLLMSAGFLFSTGVGLVMAFKYFRPRWVLWTLLAAGLIMPIAFLMMG